ncbi:MAG: hypothetical protein GX335_07050 [Firmicutes bacterium]|nr:hypothetical protein [Bacillota bacterium]
MLRNCEKCNRIFAHPTRRLCSDCYQKVQEAFILVKDYLAANPKASVAEVAKATETNVETIYEFIKAGRLNIIPRDVQLTCEICGVSIESGRICPKCRAALKQGQVSQTEKPFSEAKRDKTRIRYLDQIRKRR